MGHRKHSNLSPDAAILRSAYLSATFVDSCLEVASLAVLCSFNISAAYVDDPFVVDNFKH